MIQVNAVVEEIATGRLAQVIQVSEEGPSGQSSVVACRVRFSDRQTPHEKHFSDMSELRVIPPENTDLSIVPDTPLG